MDHAPRAKQSVLEMLVMPQNDCVARMSLLNEVDRGWAISHRLKETHQGGGGYASSGARFDLTSLSVAVTRSTSARYNAIHVGAHVSLSDSQGRPRQLPETVIPEVRRPDARSQ